MFRLAYRRMHNKHDAEDVTQTVFLRYFQKQPVFASEEHAKAWLLRVTMNCCNDLHGSAWFQKRAELPELEAPFPTKEDSDVQVKEAVETLSDKQQVAIHLMYEEGYSCDEIATITEEKPSTVRSHLHRAREALRAMLGARYE